MAGRGESRSRCRAGLDRTGGAPGAVDGRGESMSAYELPVIALRVFDQPTLAPLFDGKAA